MAKYLIVVESPTKIKSFKKYLGKDYQVLASKGHVRDLPSRTIGVDVKDDKFTPKYITIPGKEKVLDGILKAAAKAEVIYLAPDPDREGEAIAWHIADSIEEMFKSEKKLRRVFIREITKKGITESVKNYTELNKNMFNSQQTRRILDRFVGYQISPLLWKKVKGGLSAGRVQSVVVRMICEREVEVKAFKPEEYWSIDTLLNAQMPPEFSAKLVAVDESKIGKDFKITNAKQAQGIEKRLKASKLTVSKSQQKERKKSPVPPFTTSKLQQESYRKLGFNVKKTMSVAQSLYEGIEVGGDGPSGLITYMRTDSIRIADDALVSVRDYIKKTYSKDHLPKEAVKYKTKKSAQDAHESIRPTNLEYTPESIKSLLSKDQYVLYRLIWNRFVSCQMSQAIYDQLSIEFENDKKDLLLRITGSRLVFKGFLEVYEEGQDDQAKTQKNDSGTDLPKMSVGDPITLKEVKLNQHFTQPPPRFNESSMVKELDERGIGRPSTYATILSTIVDRGYVTKQENRYQPSPLGLKVNELLVESFPEILDALFTADMEDSLDKIEEGSEDWQKILAKFYHSFEKRVEAAQEGMKNVKASSEPTDVKCDECGSHMNIKWSTRGEFLGCSSYPKCRTTREFTRDADDKIQVVEPNYSGDLCSRCGKKMIIKKGGFGDYIACSNYPICPTVRSPKSEVPCPEEDCKGGLVARRTKTGRNFWGCTNYPDCQYAVWGKPVKITCENCEFPILTEKTTKKDGTSYICPSCKTQNLNVKLPEVKK